MTSVKRIGLRAAREAELGVYEEPAFAAGRVIGRQERIVLLAEACAARCGRNAYLERIADEARAAREEAARWQSLAARMTRYPHGREEAA